MRKVEFDILKGLLIVAVVIGHTSVTIPGVSIFWFHMPAFFMISGYFAKRLYADLPTLRRRVERLWVPYFAYSLLMYAIYRPEPMLWKYMLRAVYGGRYFSGLFSYPWWFIDAMLVALVAFAVFSPDHALGRLCQTCGERLTRGIKRYAWLKDVKWGG